MTVDGDFLAAPRGETEPETVVPAVKLMRLQSYLSQAGVTSRRKAAELVKAGVVQVNGQPVLEPGFAVTPGKDEIACRGKKIEFESKLYFAFNKPEGVITTTADTHGRKTVADFFSSLGVRLYPVGRLDQDTSGLLIVTNDGAFAHRLMHPSHGFHKIYEAVLVRPLERSEITKAEEGLVIDGRKSAPCRVEFDRKQGGKPVYRIDLTEGRKRQIRRMMETLRVGLVALRRVRVGSLDLGDLKPGTYREITEAERARLMKNAESGAAKRPSRGHGRPFVPSSKRRPTDPRRPMPQGHGRPDTPPRKSFGFSRPSRSQTSRPAKKFSSLPKT